MKTKSKLTSLAAAVFGLAAFGAHAQSFSAPGAPGASPTPSFDSQNMFGNSSGGGSFLSGNQSSFAPGLNLNAPPPVITTPGLPPSSIGSFLSPSIGAPLAPTIGGSLSSGIGGLPTTTTPALPPPPDFLIAPPIGGGSTAPTIGTGTTPTIGTGTAPTIGTGSSPTIGTSLSPSIGIPTSDPLLQGTPPPGSALSPIAGGSSQNNVGPLSTPGVAVSSGAAPSAAGFGGAPFNPDSLCRADDFTCRE